MTATTASDPSGVQYYFDCTAGAGGHDSSWQSSPTYQDTGLTPSTQYTYRVQTRDQSANQNTGQWSTTQNATTDAAGTGVPVFNSGTFYTPWYGTTGTGNIPYSLATTPDGQSTPAAWALRTDIGWTELRATACQDIGSRLYLEFDCYWDTDTEPGTVPAAFHMDVNGDGGWTFKWEGSSVCWLDDVQHTFNPPPTCAAKTWQHFKLKLDTNALGGTWPTSPDIGTIRIYFSNAGGSSLYLNNVAFTDGGTPPDTTPPTPNPSTWATNPYATGSTSISMTATTASDPSGVQYFFDCTAGAGGHDSAWQSSATYQDTGLTPSTMYSYRVQTRDQSANLNTGTWSTTQSATTSGGPTTLLTDGFETDFNKWTDGGTTDWDRATAQKRTGSYSGHAGSADNDLISDNLNSAGYSSMTIDFYFRDDDIDDADDIYLQVYNGSAYANRYELGNSGEDTWQHAVVTVNNSGGDAAYFISNFRIKFEGTSIDSGENLWIDDVVVTVQ
jgi:hypothetical protein